MAVRPVTPGTIVVLAGTVLLVLVSISVPILKQFYFLSITLPAVNGVQPGTILLGVWGYCVGSTCSNSTLGYTLDAAKIFGISGLAADIPAAIPDTLIKWLTYCLVLHPIAAGFGAIATVFGILSHIREFSVSAFTTCFASIGASIGLLAFIFDIVLFEIALKRINAVGGNAVLGNAIWLCLAGTLCLMFSGCFFGLGRCLIRNRRNDDPNTNLQGKTMPILPDHYGARTLVPQEEEPVAPGGYGAGAMYKNAPYTTGKGGLPIFQDVNGEIIPLNTMELQQQAEDEYNEKRYGGHGRNGSYSNSSYGNNNGRNLGSNIPESGSLVSGVGTGYGRRFENTPGLAFSPSDNSAFAIPQQPGPGAAGVGAGGGYLPANNGSRNQQQLQQPQDRRIGSSTVEPFVGMDHSQQYSNYEDQPQPHQQGPHYNPDNENNFDNNNNETYYSPPQNYPTSTSPQPINSGQHGVEQLTSYYTVPTPNITSQFSQPSIISTQPSFIQQNSYGSSAIGGTGEISTPTSNYASAIASRYSPQSQAHQPLYTPSSISPPPSLQQQQLYSPPSNPPPPPSSIAGSIAPSYYSAASNQPNTNRSIYSSPPPPLPDNNSRIYHQQQLSQQSQNQNQRDSMNSLGGEQGSVSGGIPYHKRNDSTGYQGEEAVQRRY